MSASKHTPGPWTRGHNVSHEPSVRCAAGLNDGFAIALLYGADASANGDLIAAAPELLHALKALAATADHADDDFKEYRSALRLSVQQAREAIAKAEG